MDHANARNAKNGTNVEKAQLSEDLNYKRNKRTISFFYFYLETICKDYLKEMSQIIINSYYVFICKGGVELSPILFTIIQLEITLIKQLIREQICESI